MHLLNYGRARGALAKLRFALRAQVSIKGHAQGAAEYLWGAAGGAARGAPKRYGARKKGAPIDEGARRMRRICKVRGAARGVVRVLLQR